MTAENFIVDTINFMVSKGGERVGLQQYLDRLVVCNKCPYIGEVTPLPFLKMKGCRICGCPSATKPHFKKHFSLKNFSIITTICPDKQNRWAEVDKKYNHV